MISLKTFCCKFFHSWSMHHKVDSSLLLSEIHWRIFNFHSFFDVLPLVLSRFGRVCHCSVRFTYFSFAHRKACFQWLPSIHFEASSWITGIPNIVLSWSRTMFILIDSHIWNIFFSVKLEVVTENSVTILFLKISFRCNVVEA